MKYYLFAMYASFFNTANEGRNADATMSSCVAAAINAMTGGKDYSNGANYWHGYDFFDSKGQPLYLNSKNAITYASSTSNGKSSTPNTPFRDQDNHQVYGSCWYAFESEYLAKGFSWSKDAILSGKNNRYLSKPFNKLGTSTGTYGYTGMASYGSNVFMLKPK